MEAEEAINLGSRSIRALNCPRFFLRLPIVSEPVSSRANNFPVTVRKNGKKANFCATSLLNIFADPSVYAIFGHSIRPRLK